MVTHLDVLRVPILGCDCMLRTTIGRSSEEVFLVLSGAWLQAPYGVCSARRLNYHVSVRYSLPQNVITSIPQAAARSVISANHPFCPIKTFHSGHKSRDGTLRLL